MFLSRNKQNNVYPCKPQFYYIKVGFKGVNIIIQICFRDAKRQSRCVNVIPFRVDPFSEGCKNNFDRVVLSLIRTC